MTSLKQLTFQLILTKYSVFYMKNKFNIKEAFIQIQK